MKKTLFAGESLKVFSLFAATIAMVGFVAIFGGRFVQTTFMQTANASTTTSTSETINLTVNEVITLNTSSSITLPSLTPGTPVFATTTAQVTTNAPSGWQLIITRPAASSTAIASGTITFPDQTPLFNGSNATTSGNLLNGGAVLAFRAYSAGTSPGIYSSSTWGTDDAANAMWAGIPTSTAVLTVSTSSYTSTTQNVAFGLRANAPGTQQATTYTGTITITAIALP